MRMTRNPLSYSASYKVTNTSAGDRMYNDTADTDFTSSTLIRCKINPEAKTAIIGKMTLRNNPINNISILVELKNSLSYNGVGHGDGSLVPQFIRDKEPVPPSQKWRFPMKRSIIIDTDPGIDDVVAITAALFSDKLDVKLITTVGGNVGIENTTKNAIDLVTFLGKDTPIAKGAGEPLLSHPKTASQVHGNSGIGE